MPAPAVQNGMTVRISKEFGFAAAHHLPVSEEPGGLRPGHKCSRPHGHNYTVQVTLETGDAGLVGPGFVTEFGALSPFGDYLKAEIDHRDLNEVLLLPPTSENLAIHFAEWLRDNLMDTLPGRLASVRVSETSTTWAEVQIR